MLRLAIAFSALCLFTSTHIVHAGTAGHDGEWRGEGRIECEAAPASPISTRFVVRDGRVSGEATASFRNVPFDMTLDGTVTETGVISARGTSAADVSFILKFRGRLAHNTLALTGRPVHSKKGCMGTLDVTLVAPRDPATDGSAEERLEAVQSFLDRGLITPEEAAAKRKEILDAL